MEDETEIRSFLNDVTIIDLTETIKHSAIADIPHPAQGKKYFKLSATN